MPSDLSITRVVAAAAPTPAERQSAGVPADKRGVDKAPTAPAGKSLPNPTLRLDAGLAIVVIEFRDETGTVRSTIPTEQQLDAYRSWERGNIGEPRPGRREAARGGEEIQSAPASGPRREPGAAAPAPTGRSPAGLAGLGTAGQGTASPGSGPPAAGTTPAPVKVSTTGTA